MQIITKNNRKYYRFKIGKEFESFSSRNLFQKHQLKEIYVGDITFNALKKKNLVSETYDIKKGFIYPFCDSSTANDHIKGYSKIFNFNGTGIKVCESGDAGKTKLIEGKYFIGRPAYVLTSKKFANSYVCQYLNNIIPLYKQTSVISNVMYSRIENEYIEIPVNHEKLAIVIKRILEYKQLSKQLSKQIKDYKLAILQESEKAIKNFKKTKQYDKYITFKIGDKFQILSSRQLFTMCDLKDIYSEDIKFKSMLEKNIVSYDKNKMYKYPFFDSSNSNNHVKGYSKIFNFDGIAIKVSESGEGCGSTKLINGKVFIGRPSYILVSNKYNNEFLEMLLNKILPTLRQGSTIPNLMSNYIKEEYITIPANHEKLSKKIEQLNNWQIKVEETLKKMEEYIEGVLQQSLK